MSKFSPWVSYTNGTEFYTSFKILFGDSSAGSTATSGTWSFYQGAGAMYSDSSDLTGTQVFLGLRFTYGAGGAIALTYRSGANFVNTGLTTTSLNSATVYTIEIVGNNKSSGTINYNYNGASKSVAVQKFDLYINGTLIGDDLSESQLTANAAINAGTFIGINSTSNVANVFVDDAVTYNAVPASIGSSGTTPPTLTAAGGATVDSPFNVTFPDDATWRAAITSIKVGGTTLTAGSSVSAGQITFTPSASSPATLLQSAGTKTITVQATGYTDATVSQTIGVGAPNKLAMGTQPVGPTTNGSTFATPAAVAIQDRYGNATTSTANVTAAVGTGAWTIGGTTTKAATSGTATFTDLTATSAAAVSGATISFTSSGLTGVSSNGFNIPPPPPSNDLCSNATSLTVNAAATAGTTVSATVSSPFTGDPDVWYAFTPSVSGTATIATSTTAQDLDLFIWSASCPASTGTYITSGETASLTTESASLPVTAGTTYYVRVLYFSSTSGSTAGSFTITVSEPIVSVNTTGFNGNFGTVNVGATSSEQSYLVSGAGLSANLVVTAPTGFEVSKTTGSGFASSISFTPASGSVSSSSVFVHFRPASTGAFSNNITNASTSATTQNVAVSGTGATGAVPPSVTTQAASANTTASAQLNGTVTSDGGAALTDRGFYWSTSPGVTTSSTLLSEGGTAVTTFNKALSGLSVNTIYYYRAYAVNSAGIGLGASDVSFYTLANQPTAPTVGSPTQTSLAVTIGAGDGNPAATTYAIHETTTNKYVQSGGTLGASAIYQTAGTWGTKTVSGLTGNTTYTFEILAQNGASVTTLAGPSTSGLTSPVAPTVSTQAATAFTTTGATLNGTVSNNGGATLTDRGFYWSASPNVTASSTQLSEGGTSVAAFSKALGSLSVNTIYYYRGYATNSVGTSIGASDVSFYTLANTPTAPTVTTPTVNSLNVAVGSGDGNPSTTTYAIQETSSGNYVQSGGTLGASPVYQTATTWGTKTVTGLTGATTYTFQVKARNGANTDTVFGPGTSGTTQSPPLAAWDFFNATGSTVTWDASVSGQGVWNSNLDSSATITRGAGAAASSASSSFRTIGFQNDGISTANTDYFQVTLSGSAGRTMSLSTLDANFNGTSTYFASPGVTSQFAYSLDGTTFTLIGSPVTSTSLTMTQIDLTGIAALQNVPSSTTVTIRYYASGRTSTGGWGFFSTTAGSYGLAIGGTTTACTNPTAYAVTGGGSYCSGGGGVAIGLSNSETGVNYQLYRNSGATAVGSPVAGSTGNSITFGNQTVADTYTVVGTRVTGGCTTNMTGSASVTVNAVPAAPGTITQGNPSGTVICPNSLGVTYTVAAVSGATSYTWTLPPGGVIQGVATDRTITVDYTNASSGSVTVTANNSCGSSSASSLAITVNSSTPSTPGTIAQSNPSGTSFCADSTGVVYSIAAVSGASSYTWTVPSGGTIASGQGTISITVNYSGASSGNVSVVANGACSSSPASTLAVTASTPPSNPTGISASPSCNSISVSWTAPAGAVTGYNVKRSTTSGSGYTTLPSGSNVSGSPFVDTTAAVGQTYYYVVSALNDSCESVNSSQTTGTSISTPLAPTSPFATAGNNSVSLSWTAPSGPTSATGYNVKRSTTSGSGYTTLAAGSNVAGTSFTDTTVVNNTTYYYVITAINAGCESANSTEVSATPSAALLIEDFNYTNGDLLTNHGWVAHSASGTNAIAVITPGLSYCGYVGSGVGNAASVGASGEDDNKAFTPQSSGSVYAAFMVKVTSTNTTGDYLFHFTQTSGSGAGTAGNFFAKVFAKRDASNNLAFGITKTSNTGTYTGFNYALNTTYLLVIKYTFNAGANDDSVSLFVNPGIATNEPSPLLNVTESSATDATTIAAVAVRQNLPTAIVDGIRVASTWDDTVLNSCGISAFNVTGGGAYCSGGSGVPVGLSGSQSGYTYQLYRNGGATAVGSPVTGTGNAISFGNQTVADTYTVVTTSASCSNCMAVMTGTATVIADQPPTTATVGSNQEVCGFTSNALGGNTPSIGTGTWSKVTGPGNVNFSDSHLGSSTATADAYGSYVLRWTISNGSCADSTADLTVVYDQAPTTADAGPNQTFTETSSTTMAANTPTVGSGTWSVVSGTGTITDVHDPSTTVTSLGYGPNVFRWTIHNGACADSTSDVTITRKANQTITFDPIPTKTYGDAPFDPGATASSGLSVSYVSSNTSVATVSGHTITIVGAGTSTITASQAGNGTYNAAPNVMQTLTVNRKGLSITANSGQFKFKSASDPTFTYAQVGLVSGDSISGVLSRAAGETPGSYAITQGGITNANNPNYDITFATAQFVIAGPLAAADGATRTAGSASFKIPKSALLTNDTRIHTDGTVKTDNLTVTNATNASGSDTVFESGAFVFYIPADPNDSAVRTFTYTITDAISSTTDSATVTVTTVAAEPFGLEIIDVGTASPVPSGYTTITNGFVSVPGQNILMQYHSTAEPPTTWHNATDDTHPDGIWSTGTGVFGVTVKEPGNHVDEWTAGMIFQAIRQ